MKELLDFLSALSQVARERLREIQEQHPTQVSSAPPEAEIVSLEDQTGKLNRKATETRENELSKGLTEKTLKESAKATDEQDLKPQSGSTTKQLSNGQIKAYVCCGSEFHYQSHLLRHQSTFRHLNSAKCHLCGERFSSKDDLSSHEKSVHSKYGAREYKCKICGTILFDRHRLDRHIRTLHKNDRPYKCDFCKFTAKVKYNLDRHIKRLHTKVERNFKCDVCSLLFLEKYHLDAHKRTIHSKDCEQCAICFRTFPNRRDLDIHMKFHLPGNNYLCQVCGKAFKTFSKRERHVIIHTKPPAKKKSAKQNSSRIPKNVIKKERVNGNNNALTKQLRLFRKVKNNSLKVNTALKDVVIEKELHNDANVQDSNDEFTYVDVEGLDSENINDGGYILPDVVESESSCDTCCSNCSSSDCECNVSEATLSQQNLHDGLNFSTKSKLNNNKDSQSNKQAISNCKSDVPSKCTASPDLTEVSSICNTNMPDIKATVSSSSEKCLHNTNVSMVLSNIVENVSNATSEIVERAIDLGGSSPRNVDSGFSLSRVPDSYNPDQAHRLKEITLQESNLPKCNKIVNKIPTVVAHQLDLNQVSSPSAYEQEIITGHVSPSPCEPDILDSSGTLPCTKGTSASQSTRLRKRKERTILLKKKPQNIKKKIMNTVEVPKVFMTDLSDESDVFVLPEFFTEDDVENWLPLPSEIL